MISYFVKAVLTDALRSLKRPGVWLLIVVLSATFFLVGRCSRRSSHDVVVSTFEEVTSNSREVIESNEEFLEKEY